MVVEAVVIDLAVAIESEDVAADFEVERDETIKLKTFYRWVVKLFLFKKKKVDVVVVAVETVIVTNAVNQAIFLEIAGRL